MVVGHRIIFIISIITIPVFAVQNGIYLQYGMGMEAYKNGQYDLAIQEFESILSNNLDSPELYYNLGNAFYRIGNTSGAVWAFESCLKLSPSHSDAKYNLMLANLKVVDKMVLPEAPIYLKWYLVIKEQFTPSTWINISLFILLIFSIIMTVSQMISSSILQHLRESIIVIFFVSLFLTIHSIWTDNSLSLGVIYATKVEAHSEPNVFSTRLFEVHEGLRVSINQAVDDWVEIELLDGKTGWIENNQIRLIR